MGNNKHAPSEPASILNYKNAFVGLVFNLAIAALLKNQGFSWSLRFYQRGGGGLNIYKYCPLKEKSLRRFALDYHPIWNKSMQQEEYRLHYHRGKKIKEIKKHRPFEGGW